MADDKDTEIQHALETRQQLGARLAEQREKLMQLEAHKKTLLSALVKPKICHSYPAPIKMPSKHSVIEVPGTYPLYVLNPGLLVADPDPCTGIAYPIGYTVLRRFAKHRKSSTERAETFYTSMIVSKGGRRFYIIKDDENNVCRGANAFEDFAAWFGHPIPFRNVEEWLGLNKKEVQQQVIQTTREPMSRPKTLDDYFNRL